MQVRMLRLAWFKVGFDISAMCTRLYLGTHMVIIGYGGRRL
jgi:hypothetical protein